MSELTPTERGLVDAVEAGRDELVELAQKLVRIPSQNLPPGGEEEPAQLYIQKWLAGIGVQAELIYPDRVEGLCEHELFFRGQGCERRDYAGRPNLAARVKGGGAGRSLILSSHIDTMPAGKTEWQYDPFGGHVAGGRLYGRGSFDMKAGIAAELMAIKTLRQSGVGLAGDIVFESVVDEEHAGSNGTLANRLTGYGGDAVFIPEPSSLQLYHAHKGSRLVHLTLRGKSGMSFAGEQLPNPVEHVGSLIEAFKEFRCRRRQTAPAPPEYANDADPVPVFLNKLQAGEFSLNIPMQIPETCTLEIYWQTMPGETREDVDREFFDFLDAWVAEHPSLKQFGIEHRFSLRWMPGTRIDRDSPILRVVEDSAAALGRPVEVTGAPYPCDLFVFNHFGIPGVIFGPCGENCHGSDENVEIDSVVQVTQALVLSLVRFCGLA